MKKKFTLFEIVVAIGISTLIASMIGAILFSFQKSWETNNKIQQKLETYMKLESIANHTFRNAIPFVWKDENKKNIMFFKGESNFVKFAHLNRINTDVDTGIRFIRLSFASNNLVAKYSSYPSFIESNTCRTEIIAKNLKAVYFHYATYNNDKIIWKNYFNNLNDTDYPKAIKMTIVFDDKEKLVFIRRTAGNSYISTYGEEYETR